MNKSLDYEHLNVFMIVNCHFENVEGVGSVFTFVIFLLYTQGCVLQESPNLFIGWDFLWVFYSVPN